VRLLLNGGDFLRFWIPPPAAAGDEILLAPYWRFRGIDCALRADPYRVDERVIDATFPALAEECLPPSLGLRPQALRLRFASPLTPAFFLLPTRTLAEALAGVEPLARAGDALAGETQAAHREFIAETASLVYAPLVVRGTKVLDALLGRELADCAEHADRILAHVDRRRGWELRFLPALCPECGRDLLGDRRSVVLLCPQCRVGYAGGRAGLRRVPYLVVPAARDAIAVPFWRLRVAIHGRELETAADLVRFGNLPRGVTTPAADAPLAFWAPAFSFHPRLFLRLSRQLTILQPQVAAEEGGLIRRFLPVGFADRGALGVVKSVLAEIGVPRGEMPQLIPRLEVEPRESALVFLPFEERGGDLVQPQMGFAVPKSALQPAGHRSGAPPAG
jgi:predicted Zn-ribbon and HTH transcriptional regulator